MLTALALLCALHPDSTSSSRITVAGAEARVEVRCQAQSLIESLPLDHDGDGALGTAELESARGELERYLAAHYRLYAAGEREPDRARELSSRLDALALVAPDSSGKELVDLALVFRAPEPLTELWIESRLFREQNPLHRDAASLTWNGAEQASWLFPESGELWRFRPQAERRPGVFWAFLKSGVEHILTGYDHIAFLLALVLAAPSWLAVLGVVTAFTAAHSLTLALAALELVHVRSSWVEMAIALSIAYVAALNLVAPKPSARWIEAFAFGLIHGLGFAGSILETLLFEPLKVTALAAFNIGVEGGQLAVVGLLALLLSSAPGDRSFGERERAFLAPRWARVAGSIAVIGLGLYWFAERAGWIAGLG